MLGCYSCFMNIHETPPSDIDNFRKRVEEIAKSGKYEDSYAETLKETVDELLFSISQTIGKVEGGDMSTSSEIPEAELKELQDNVKKLKDLLP